ncbi:MAG TPA: hypothetical protein V6D07_19085 [Trichocoleus sp.]
MSSVKTVKTPKAKDSKPQSTGVDIRKELERLFGVDSIKDFSRDRDLEELKNSEIHLLAITISTNVRNTVKLSFKDINLDNQAVRQLKRMKAQEIKVPLLGAVHKAYASLNRIKRKALKNIKFFDPFWYIPETKKAEVLDYLKEMLEEVPRLRAKIEAEYEQSEKEFAVGLTRIVSRQIPKPMVDPAMRLIDPKQAREEYLEAKNARRLMISEIVKQKQTLFPSKESCVQGLRLGIQWGGTIPSLKQQAETDAKLARVLADEEISELERQKALNELEAEQMTARARREVYQRICQTSINEFYRAISEGLHLVESNMQGAALNHRRRARILEAIANLDNLLVYAKEAANLEELAIAKTELETLLCKSAEEDGRDRLQKNLKNRIEALREWVRPNLQEEVGEDFSEVVAGNMLL